MFSASVTHTSLNTFKNTRNSTLFVAVMSQNFAALFHNFAIFQAMDSVACRCLDWPARELPSALAVLRGSTGGDL